MQIYLFSRKFTTFVLNEKYISSDNKMTDHNLDIMNIKNFLIYGLASLTLFSCQHKNVEITGEIKEAGKQTVYLEQLNVDNIQPIDSAPIDRKGRFTFKTNITTPTYYNIRIGKKETITVIGEPDSKIILSGTLNGLSKNYWVDGSENSLWIKLLNFQLNKTLSVRDSLKKMYIALPATDPGRQNLSDQWDSITSKQIKFSKDFILKHAISPAAYYALYQKFDNDNFILSPIEDLHSYKVVASSLKAMHPESQYTAAIMKHLGQINKSIRNQKLQQFIAQSSTSLPEIALPNVQGDTVRLNSLKGKYIVLDFTVLGTKDSKSYIDEFKNIYNKFRHKNVQIYQVCLDQNRLMWEKLVKQYGIDWVCVQDANGLQSKAARSWNIQNVPANYIISPEADVVGKNLYGRRLEERLNDLLK